LILLALMIVGASLVVIVVFSGVYVKRPCVGVRMYVPFLVWCLLTLVCSKAFICPDLLLVPSIAHINMLCLVSYVCIAI
jgi:hypothetical protein